MILGIKMVKRPTGLIMHSSGMPTYQLGAKYPHNYIKQLDLLIRFLPRPRLPFYIFWILFFNVKP